MTSPTRSFWRLLSLYVFSLFSSPIRRGRSHWDHRITLAILAPVILISSLYIFAAINSAVFHNEPRGFNTQIEGDMGPTWSPDGTRFALASPESGNYDIYIENENGRERTNLTNSPNEDTHPTWSPDGSRIAFRSQNENGSTIHVIRPDGTGETNLTFVPALYVQMAWSPDGSKIAFVSNRDAVHANRPRTPVDVDAPFERPKRHRPDVYVVNADGSDRKRLTVNEVFDGEPSWSPDGSKIVFQSLRDGNSEIYVMDADGGNQTRLTHNDRPDVTPAWSPDGAQIAFASKRPETAFGAQVGALNFDIYLMNADGSNQTNVTRTPITDDSRPVWSPDGRLIAYDGRYKVAMPAVPGNNEIYLMRVDDDNTGPTPLTNNPTLLDPDRHKGPVWSPDSRFIAYSSLENGTARIRLLEIENRDEKGAGAATTIRRTEF